MALAPPIGIDLGNQNSLVAITRRGGIDIVCNEGSNRFTPSLVALGAKERLLGEAAAGQYVMNPKSTLSEFKRLIGRKFSAPDVQEELKNVLFKTKELPNGNVGVEVMYKDQLATFSMEQILAMFLGGLRRDVERETKSKATDVVIGIPGYWNDAQRRSLIAAAEIAGLHVQSLIHETTALALQYGLFRLDFDEKTPNNVMFVDFGHTGLSVVIVAFTKSKLQVLSSAYDPNLGGRDFDEVLVRHFAAEFKQKFKVDVFTNPRALLRVRVACEKVKKMLSANSDAPINIECLMNDVDVRGSMKRDQFEQMIQPLLERLQGPIKVALADAKLQASELYAVEAVGGTIRIPAVQRTFESILGRELGKTQNGTEAVVKGCALQSAMLSVGARVREYHVNDAFLFPMSLQWGPPGQPAPADNSMEMVRRYHTFPLTQNVTFRERSAFQIAVGYTTLDNLPAGTTPLVGRWTVQVPHAEAKQEIKVKATLNLSGLVGVLSAQLVETTEVEEPVVTPTPAPAPAAAATPSAPAAAAAAAPSDGPEKMATDEPAKPAAAEAPKAPEVKKKTVTKLINLTIQAELPNAVPPQVVKQLAEEESKMAGDDRVFIETADRRNALETYILNMRSKLQGVYAPYSSEQDKKDLMALCDTTEAWFNDAPDDTTKATFVEKLAALEKIGEPIVARYKDFTVSYPDAIDSARKQLNDSRKLLASTDAKHDHITATDKAPALAEIAETSAWLDQQQAALAASDKTKNLTLPFWDIGKKATAAEKKAREVMAKAKPAPPPAPKPEPKPAAAPATDGAPKHEEKPTAAAADGGAAASSADAPAAAAAGATPEKKGPEVQMDLD